MAVTIMLRTVSGYITKKTETHGIPENWASESLPESIASGYRWR
jgi:hypothetical protein